MLLATIARNCIPHSWTITDQAHVLYTFACIVVIYVAYSTTTSSFSTEARFFRHQRRPGRVGWFTTLDTILGSRAILAEGYSKWSKTGKTFAFSVFGGKTVIMVPNNDIPELMNKPSSEVSNHAAIHEALAMRWQGDMDIDGNPLHYDVVKRQLTRKLPLFTEPVLDELKMGFEVEWQDVNADSWTDVPAFGSCSKIISRAANRIFCGAELCKNPEFLQAALKYAEAFFASAQIIVMLPWCLRPLLAPIFVWPKHRQSAICQRLAVPIIEKRIQEGEAQNDCISWMIEECKKRDPVEMDPSRLCRRVLRLNMVAIHTTSMTMTNTLLDLYSSPRAEEFVAGLREECKEVFEANDCSWTKAAVNQLHRVDSAIKESMRMSGIATIALFRTVVHKDGAQLGDVHVPTNVNVAVASGAIHRDPEFYASPESYDAFRFSRSHEAIDDKGNIIDKRSHAIVTTSDRFLEFGHGRNACPGRFFAAQEMKLMLAHLVLNYDVKVEGGRSPPFDFRTAVIPSSKSRLQVRLRRG